LETIRGERTHTWGKYAACFQALGKGWIEQPLPNAGKHVTGVTREETVQHVFPRLTSVAALFDWSIGLFTFAVM